jgi:iron(III) transport system permease protein
MNSVQAVTQNYGIVAASSALLLVILLVTVKLQRRLLGDTRRFVTIGSKASRQKDFDLGVLRWPATAFILVIMMAIVGLPLIGVLLQAFAEFFSPLIPYSEVFTFDNFIYLTSRPIYLRALTNSLIVSAVGAAVGTLLVFLVAAIVSRTKHRFGPTLESFAMLPRAVPAMIAGLGFFYASVIFPPLDWTRGTLIILMIAFIMRYLPLGFGAVLPSMVQVSPDLEHSARTSGASWLQTMFAIIMPVLKPSLLAAYAIFFLQFFKDYATAVFLYSPGTEILGTVMLLLVWDGHTGAVAALSTVQVLITGAFILIVGRLAKVKLYD